MTEGSREMMLRELEKMALGLTQLEKDRFLITHDVYLQFGAEAAVAAERLIAEENIDPSYEDFDFQLFIDQVRARIKQ